MNKQEQRQPLLFVSSKERAGIEIIFDQMMEDLESAIEKGFPNIKDANFRSIAEKNLHIQRENLSNLRKEWENERNHCLVGYSNDKMPIEYQRPDIDQLVAAALFWGAQEMANRILIYRYFYENNSPELKEALSNDTLSLEKIHRDISDINERTKKIEKKVECVPTIVHENQTEEGRTILKADGILQSLRCTREEIAVFKAWFNDGKRNRSQSEIARETKLSISTVRRRAYSYNQKAKGNHLIIVWNKTPKRDRSPQARDIVHSAK